MLGYAESPADLGRGRDITELRTGDLARRTPEGLIEIVGRVNRIAKVFGLRIDLTRVERTLLDAGIVGARRRRGRPGRGGGRPVGRARSTSRGSGGSSRSSAYPRPASSSLELDGVPRLASGKPDYSAIAARATPRPRAT